MTKPPFDMKTLLGDLHDLKKVHHADPSGKGAGAAGLSGGNGSNQHSQSPTSGNGHDIPMSPSMEEIPPAEDAINPAHYRRHPSGIECIEITRWMNFNIGNAIKYLWRYDSKGDPVENLKKAAWYIMDEINRLERK